MSDVREGLHVATIVYAHWNRVPVAANLSMFGECVWGKP